jgi:hypothetical protein
MTNITQNRFHYFLFSVPTGFNGPNSFVLTVGDVLELSWFTQYTKMNLILGQFFGPGLPLPGSQTLIACMSAHDYRLFSTDYFYS